MEALKPGSRRYICRRCQLSFDKGEGKPDMQPGGLGKCNRCLSQQSKPPT